jgi:hypothetical protein
MCKKLLQNTVPVTYTTALSSDQSDYRTTLLLEPDANNSLTHDKWANKKKTEILVTICFIVKKVKAPLTVEDKLNVIEELKSG